jgi:hypothetical protein
VGYLLGQDQSLEASACGEPAANFLPGVTAAVGDLRIDGPPLADADVTALGELRADHVGLLWQIPAAGPPGVYRVRDGDQTVYALATAVGAEESDLTPLAPSLLTERLAGGRTIEYHDAAHDDAEPRDELWTWLALACVGCLVGEIVGLKLFRQ